MNTSGPAPPGLPQRAWRRRRRGATAGPRPRRRCACGTPQPPGPARPARSRGRHARGALAQRHSQMSYAPRSAGREVEGASEASAGVQRSGRTVGPGEPTTTSHIDPREDPPSNSGRPSRADVTSRKRPGKGRRCPPAHPLPRPPSSPLRSRSLLLRRNITSRPERQPSIGTRWHKEHRQKSHAGARDEPLASRISRHSLSAGMAWRLLRRSLRWHKRTSR